MKKIVWYVLLVFCSGPAFAGFAAAGGFEPVGGSAVAGGFEPVGGSAAAWTGGLATRGPRLDTATFATGCFWCTEATFKELRGVKKVTAGFSGGHTVNPTYKEVCTGTTGHAESCNIVFDPRVISYDTLLEVFFTVHDPTQLNRQGNDVGTQYRSAIFYHNAVQRQKADYYIKKINEERAYPKPVVTQVVPYTVFYKAEDYHQDYYSRNGDVPYCKYVIQPEVAKFKRIFASKLKGGAPGHANNPYYSNTDTRKLNVSDAEWKKILSPALYATAREQATERAFTGKYWNSDARGTYYCAVCGNELFRADAKFASTCGWPSFFEPVRKNSVSYRSDRSLGMDRTEVLCARCGSHLGHIFDDGPPPTHKRYCMNSISLDFQPDK